HLLHHSLIMFLGDGLGTQNCPLWHPICYTSFIIASSCFWVTVLGRKIALCGIHLLHHSLIMFLGDGLGTQNCPLWHPNIL
ncbi:hypothetical protein IRJ41_012878, partial [Triplophysa rosa]